MLGELFSKLFCFLFLIFLSSVDLPFINENSGCLSLVVATISLKLPTLMSYLCFSVGVKAKGCSVCVRMQRISTN